MKILLVNKNLISGFSLIELMIAISVSSVLGYQMLNFSKKAHDIEGESAGNFAIRTSLLEVKSVLQNPNHCRSTLAHHLEENVDGQKDFRLQVQKNLSGTGQEIADFYRYDEDSNKLRKKVPLSFEYGKFKVVVNLKEIIAVEKTNTSNEYVESEPYRYPQEKISGLFYYENDDGNINEENILVRTMFVKLKLVVSTKKIAGLDNTAEGQRSSKRRYVTFEILQPVIVKADDDELKIIDCARGFDTSLTKRFCEMSLKGTYNSVTKSCTSTQFQFALDTGHMNPNREKDPAEKSFMPISFSEFGIISSLSSSDLDEWLDDQSSIFSWPKSVVDLFRDQTEGDIRSAVMLRTKNHAIALDEIITDQEVRSLKSHLLFENDNYNDDSVIITRPSTHPEDITTSDYIHLGREVFDDATLGYMGNISGLSEFLISSEEHMKNYKDKIKNIRQSTSEISKIPLISVTYGFPLGEYFFQAYDFYDYSKDKFISEDENMNFPYNSDTPKDITMGKCELHYTGVGQDIESVNQISSINNNMKFSDCSAACFSGETSSSLGQYNNFNSSYANVTGARFRCEFVVNDLSEYFYHRWIGYTDIKGDVTDINAIGNLYDNCTPTLIPSGKTKIDVLMELADDWKDSGSIPSEISTTCDPIVDSVEKFEKLFFLDSSGQTQRRIVVYDGPASSNQLVVTAGDRQSNDYGPGIIETQLLTDTMVGIDHPARGMVIKGDLILSSDIRLKKNIKPISILEKLKLNNIKGRSYLFKDTNTKDLGVIAQDIENIFPELVQNILGTKKVNYIGLIPLLLEKIKMNQIKIDKLTNRIKDMR